MNPLFFGGGLASMLLGGLLGSKERPMLDPRMLDQLFGARALSNKSNMLYNLLVNSPAYSQQMNSAAMQGNQLRNNMMANLAKSGLAGSPVGSFAQAAGRGYGASLQRGAKGNLFLQALQQAANMNQSQQDAYVQSFLGRQSKPTFGQQLGGSLLGGGSSMLASLFNPGR